LKFKQKISEEIFKKKYMINNEASEDEVFKKISKEIASVEKGVKNKQFWESKFYDEISSGRLIPAGRILANARPKARMPYYNNCYTIAVEDSINKIYDSLKEDANISSTGGGVGLNFSNLRPKNASLSKGGKSSGVISFMKVFNESAKIIQTGGSRRAAHIGILNVDHPEIEDFITCKQGDENKALTQFNISVGITDAFMHAVSFDKDWDLVFEGKVYKTVKAKYLYELMTKNAYIHNEPGILNLDTVNKYNNGYYDFEIQEVNPCGEICVIGDTKVNTDFGILRIKDLIERFNNGEKIKVYSVNKKGELELNTVEWGGKTGVNSQLIEIELKNGKTLKVTPNHKLFISPTQTMTAKEYLEMWNNLGVRAKRRGEYPHLVHLNRSMRNEHYIKVKASTQKEYILEHHLNYGEKIEEGWNVHHLDENTLNNSKENLEKMLHGEHSRISNEGHPDYSQGVKVKKKSILKQTGDVSNTGSIKNVKWGETEDVYDITVSENHNFFAEGVLIHNCMPPYSLCCLSSINLTKYVVEPFTSAARFDYKGFSDTVGIGVRFLDNVLDATKYPLQKIEDVSKLWRRIGLGFTGLGDTFAMLGIVYGDEDTKLFSKKLGRTLRDESYKESVALAREKGKFKKCNNKLIVESEFIKQLPEELIKDIRKYGLRNVALNTTAPTGTTSFSIGQNCSSGIEPIFSLQYDRAIRTGFGDETKTETVYDYAWLKYLEYLKTEGKTFIDTPKAFVTTFDIDVYDAIDIQAIFQKYIDHSISKTLNLPIGTTYEEYNNLFQYAYDHELKGFTTFNPEGSMKGILSVSPSKEKTNEEIKIENNSSKRPKELSCDIHELKINKEKFIALVGMYDNLPYEIFVTKNIDEEFDFNKHKTGKIVKVKKGVYSLVLESDVYIEDITGSFNEIYGTLGRFISMGLRHQVPLQFIVEQLAKDKNFMGFEKTVSRVLKKYIKEGEKVKSNIVCPECGNTELMYQEGCLSCTCGWSRCS